MTAPLTAAELREIEERALDAVEDSGAVGAFAELRTIAREDIPRLITTVKALRTLLHGVAWNDAAIDMALSGLTSAEAKR